MQCYQYDSQHIRYQQFELKKWEKGLNDLSVTFGGKILAARLTVPDGRRPVRRCGFGNALDGRRWLTTRPSA
jgi:hypothetical protein